ncbi:trigger factor [Echinimonas agarilytica]|uniref:Trigger factor n=1 Tax=Echinimonas agarilytica TaxID=1215918 RepID=A0AA41W5P3_9GAMM|nr:trigger factor [Echinimonas agarilytica]MCM2679266.1 trigger factor [Echinimonas agarilytica]
MQVSVETTQGLERCLTITVPAEKVDSAVQSQLRRMASDKNRRVPGFRPGKVPVSVITKMYGPSVRQDVVGEVAQRSYVEAIIAEKINPAGSPRLELTESTTGTDLQFKATVEVYPEFEVAGVDKIEVEKPVVTIGEADLDDMIETLRKQNAEWEDVSRAAADGDKANINFVGKIDGEEFEGGKADAFDITIGGGQMIPGFEDAIIGAEAGKEVVANVTFPDNYHAENLKGKEAEFAITVNSIQGQILPEITEEFVKKFGVETGDIAQLREEVKKNMQRELDQNLKTQVKEQVIEGLVSQNEIDLPSALITQEIDALRQQAMQRFGDQAKNAPELPAELFKEQAEKRVKIGLVLGEFIKANELKVEDERVEAQIATMASAYEDADQVIEYYKGNEQLMEQMRNVALEDQAIDALLAKAKVTEVEKSFKDVMQPAQ